MHTKEKEIGKNNAARYYLMTVSGNALLTLACLKPPQLLGYFAKYSRIKTKPTYCV